MEKIIDPVDKALILAELTPDKKLRDTNKGGNELYLVNWYNSPNVVREIGRLREIAFRAEGGATGKSVDIDEFDTMEKPYGQLVVWDPDAEAIIGGYRYVYGPDVRMMEDGQPYLSSAHLFHYSDTFIKEYLPHVMELGRSFVAPEYQSSKAGAKAIFALDNLWDGIAALILVNPDIKYFYGKMTIHPSYDTTARNIIHHFLLKHFGDEEGLVTPKKEYAVDIEGDRRLYNLILNKNNFKDDFTNLKNAVSELGTSVPPLVNSYMRISPTMKMFGMAKNDELSDAYEIGILVCYDEMYDEKKNRHIESFARYMTMQIKKRFPNIEEGFEGKLLERWNRRRKNRQ